MRNKEKRMHTFGLHADLASFWTQKRGCHPLPLLYGQCRHEALYLGIRYAEKSHRAFLIGSTYQPWGGLYLCWSCKNSHHQPWKEKNTFVHNDKFWRCKFTNILLIFLKSSVRFIIFVFLLVILQTDNKLTKLKRWKRNIWCWAWPWWQRPWRCRAL